MRFAGDMKCVLALILAGGKGSRLGPLTQFRSKPSVQFGKNLIIDFAMSNCLNSGIDNMMVFTQYRAQELVRHVQRHWPSDWLRESFIETVSPQQIYGPEWYRGTADAVSQNISLIDERGDFVDVAILAGDHVYMMDFRQMYAFHKEKQAVFTVCALPMEVSEAHRLGVIEVNNEGRIVGFEEKPAHPKEIPGRPGFSYVSMGNYFAAKKYLWKILEENAQNDETTHDFGRDIIPMMVERGDPIYAYDFRENHIDGMKHHYWRDVGTIQSLWEGNMDLATLNPELSLYNKKWVIRTPHDNLPMEKTNSLRPVDGRESGLFLGRGGCIIEDTHLYQSVIGRESIIYRSQVTESVIFSGVQMDGAILHRVIVGEDVHIPPGTIIGIDRALDEERKLHIDKSGIVVVPKGFVF